VVEQPKIVPTLLQLERRAGIWELTKEFTMSMLKLVEVPPPIEDATGQMARYGITRVPVDYFHFREFRYTSFADALAQAQRQAERDGMTAQTR
jgi:hypothetical protein